MLCARAPAPIPTTTPLSSQLSIFRFPSTAARKTKAPSLVAGDRVRRGLLGLDAVVDGFPVLVGRGALFWWFWWMEATRILVSISVIGGGRQRSSSLRGAADHSTAADHEPSLETSSK